MGRGKGAGRWVGVAVCATLMVVGPGKLENVMPLESCVYV